MAVLNSGQRAHQLRLALEGAYRKVGATQVEHQTGLARETVRRFLSAQGEPLSGTMAMLWMWASTYADGEVREIAEVELKRRGVSAPRRPQTAPGATR